MSTVILGAGLSGLSTAYFLQEAGNGEGITILEKEDTIGGLCKSVRKDGYIYDIGPHILFSKDKEMLDILIKMAGRINNLKRSNQILYKGKYVQYPFENDLSKLPPEDLRYCIDSFNHNPYEDYEATNMIQFFLKTFGEGITECYLRPYNEKIWKFDPAFMGIDMVDRIPKPTSDEIRRSAAGETVDGYVHQLYFSYPENGGIESVVRGFEENLSPEICEIKLHNEVCGIERRNGEFLITTNQGEYRADRLISTIPVQELCRAFHSSDAELLKRAEDLKYNSIIIAFVRLPYDLTGQNFTFTVPDKNVIFHRISKMDFLGEAYHREGESTYVVEITYREHDRISIMGDEAIEDAIAQGLKTIGHAKKVEDVEVLDIIREKYAYVIYDLKHAKNMEYIRDFFHDEAIFLNGRFGNFEYWNMDRILRESKRLVESIS